MINIILAVLAAIVAAVGFAQDLWRAIPAAVCAVVFGLEAAGVSPLGRTARALRRLRDARR